MIADVTETVSSVGNCNQDIAESSAAVHNRLVESQDMRISVAAANDQMHQWIETAHGKVEELELKANRMFDHIVHGGVAEKDQALESIGQIDGAINKVSSMRSEFGSIQTRINSTIRNLEVQAINHESARSNIEDTDVAESVAKLSSAQIKKAAGTSVLVQANNNANSALSLL